MDLLNGLKTAMGIKAFCQARGFLMPREDMNMKGGIVRTCVENVSAKIKPACVMLIVFIFYTEKVERKFLFRSGETIFRLVFVRAVRLVLISRGEL